MARLTLAVLALLLLGATSEAAKILAVFAFPGKSHFGAYAPYLEELALRGHDLTVVSAFPRKTPMANYTDIVLEDTFSPKDSATFNIFEIREQYFFPMMFFMFSLCYDSCEKVLQQPNMLNLIHSNDKEFDLVLIEPFFTECTYGLLHKFKAPVIQILPNTLVSWNGDSMGNPSTISYIPDIMMEKQTLDFHGRLLNVVRSSFLYLFRKFYTAPHMEKLMRKYFHDPTLPSIEEIEKNTAFLFLHSHPIINYPRPLTPNTIEVGGLHLKEATNKLPQDLKKFMDDAPHGVIYFSLGSNVRSVDMPEAKRNAILKSFSKLKQKVLWKWESDSLPGQPENVRLGKWFPQREILAHPNLKLFISHGGLMSIQEATFFGVPLVAIPILADQKFNAIHAQSSGYALVVEVHNITEESISWSIEEIINNPRYRENARRISAIFRDQPQTPMQRAVFWTEYAIRHQGAPHMRSAALRLNLFQYYLLDVAAALGLAALVASLLLLACARAICRCCCARPPPKSVTSRNKKRN